MGEFTDYTRPIYYSLREFVVSEPFESPKVSVIIHCYNVGKYLDACLESLVMQTLKEIEIICINEDGTDGTSDVLSAYSWADKRIRVIKHYDKKQTVTENSGFDMAKGEYVISLNPKKKIAITYLEIFYNKKLMESNDTKNILVFNTACFGDVLLCNSLVQNIKRIYPKSKVIFVCDKNWYDVAKYQEGVDDVVIYDKKGEHKGLFGMFKFVKNFKYKKPFASFITYKNGRNFVISKLLQSRYVISENKNFGNLSKQEQHAKLLEELSHKMVKNLPIKFNVPENITNKVSTNDKYIVLCTTSKKITKDMPVETAIDLINMINGNTGYKVVFTGVGQKSVDYSNELVNAKCEFINLTNQTSLLECAKVLEQSDALISVDTGTMHLGYALNVPTVAVFYEQNITNTWAPKEELYNVKIITGNDTPQNTINTLMKLISKENIVYA